MPSAIHISAGHIALITGSLTPALGTTGTTLASIRETVGRTIVIIIITTVTVCRMLAKG